MHNLLWYNGVGVGVGVRVGIGVGVQNILLEYHRIVIGVI